MQESIMDRCIAVAQNGHLFNVYTTTALLMSELAEDLMHTDAVVSSFLTAVSEVRAALSWLDDEINLSSGSILQLSQLATALPTMNGCNDVMVTVRLIDMRSQLEQCCQFLKILGSDSAVRLGPITQIASGLQHIVALKEQATGQQIDQVLRQCQELFPSAHHIAFVKHFAVKDSALFNAYLQHSWQQEIDLLIQAQGRTLLHKHDAVVLGTGPC